MKRRRNLWLLLLAVVFLASWYFGRHLDDRPVPAVETAAEPEPTAPGWTAPPGEQETVHLRVLNGTGRKGLAQDFSLLLGRAGCVAETVDNAPRDDFPRTILVNRRLDEDRARDLAGLFGGIPVVREWDDRTSEDAVLVLGADHAAVRSRLEEAAAGK